MLNWLVGEKQIAPHIPVFGTAPRFFELIREKTPRYIWAESRRCMPILSSALGVDTGVVGAAALLEHSRPDGPGAA